MARTEKGCLIHQHNPNDTVQSLVGQEHSGDYKASEAGNGCISQIDSPTTVKVS